MGFKKRPRVKLPVLTEWQQRAIPALEESIAHWERLASGQQREGESVYARDCACCTEWYVFERDAKHDCEGCPVYARSGFKYCVDTPHIAAAHGFERAVRVPTTRRKNTFLRAAAIERDWLKETLEMVKRGEVKP